MAAKKSEKWKPKHKWIESMTINLETGKTKYKYFIPKTPEEEKQLESDWDAKTERVFDILFPNELMEELKKPSK